MFCYIHYFISQHGGKRSDTIFNQLYDAIKTSKLYEKLTEIRIITSGNKNQLVTNFDTFSKVKVVHHDDDTLLFEFPALKKMFDDCQTLNDDIPILYMHLKGSSKPQNNRDEVWTKEMLNLVFRYDECIEKLQIHDAVGVKQYDGIIIDSKICRHFQGNFFWSKPAYIKTLPSPEKESLKLTHGFMIKDRISKGGYTPTWCNHRYLCEYWIGMGNHGQTHNLYDLKI